MANAPKPKRTRKKAATGKPAAKSRAKAAKIASLAGAGRVAAKPRAAKPAPKATAKPAPKPAVRTEEPPPPPSKPDAAAAPAPTPTPTQEAQNAARPLPPRTAAVALWSLLVVVVSLAAAAVTWPFWNQYVPQSVLARLMPQDEKKLAGVTGRVAALEKALRAGEAAAAAQDLELERAKISSQLDVLMERLESQEKSLKTVQKMAQATAPPAEARTTHRSIQQLSERLSHLEKNNAALETLLARLARLEKSSAAAKTARPKTGGAQGASSAPDKAKKTQALIIAVMQVRETLRTSRPFTNDLAALKAVAAGSLEVQAAIRALEPFAAAGVPTLATLRKRFDVLAGEIVRAENAMKGEGWLVRTINRFAALITVRRTENPPPGSLDAQIAEAERSMAAGDLMTAVKVIGGLSGNAAAVAKGWVKDARAKLSVERALATLQVHAVARLTSANE